MPTFGRSNGRYKYKLGKHNVLAVNRCTALGLISTDDFVYAYHITTIVSKATFSSRDKSFLKNSLCRTSDPY